MRDFCLVFPHYTWTFPDGNTHNQIDHILIGDGGRVTLDVRICRGADYDTDHYMVVENLGIILRWIFRKWEVGV